MADRDTAHAREEMKREIEKVSHGQVGRDVPDVSKEHNTEIAVNAGRKGTADRRKDQSRK